MYLVYITVQIIYLIYKIILLFFKYYFYAWIEYVSIFLMDLVIYIFIKWIKLLDYFLMDPNKFMEFSIRSTIV